ncbi:hypothetical protein [Anaerocolumna sp. MB42-C2]|uniref:hypothetical protein n=1 Tax=Anaerocolumna sp. MB42-C2 TaxID=3070997 RepID=UPI0027DF7BAB|nr:hypothetical protein [Anaerocolumna sp. MB42-C2]WMJ87535.1 hypothetical protein RBU59_26455 [Anaerocolumna sp. MB42-C2]
MSTKANIIGFLGIETYDIILYLSKLLFHLNKKVLIVDNSDTEALTYCIPIPASMNPKINRIHFCNLDFIKEKNVTDYLKEYDYILIDFGFKTNHMEIHNCSYIYLVTDKQQHNLARILNLKCKQEVFLIIKDRIKNKSLTYLLEMMKDNGINIKQYYCLYYDDLDKENMTGIQYRNEISFKHQSGQMKDLLNELIETLSFNKIEAGQAYKKAKRGA